MRLKKLAQKMGLYDKAGYIDDLTEIENLDIPAWIRRGLDILNPDAFYFDNYEQISNPVFILFFKDIKDSGEINLHKKIWNFNMSPVVINIKEKDIEIFNGFKYDKNSKFLKKLSLNISDFTYFKLRTGKTWEGYREFYRSKDRVDYYLLNNIDIAIKKLESIGLKRLYANGIIGRLIFTRYLLDRNINIDFPYIKGKNQKIKKQALLQLILDKQKLYSHFDYIRKKFNGDLFPVYRNEKKKITRKHLDIIYDLFSGVNLRNNQLNMFDAYDFSIIPIELISNIYERFIGDKKQKTNKSFYTPLFLVDYILSKTVSSKIVKQQKVKVLDPSCGSGIFLVETYRKIIENNLSKEETISSEKLIELLNDCIYGIDIDENAINIAIFSLYLTLLDYLEPITIDDFRFPKLKNRNFFSENFFDLDATFNYDLKGKNFDFIFGNPPWGRKGGKHLKYTKEHKIPVSGKQIAQSFLVRASEFGNQDTIYSFIISSKILYNLNAEKFRNYILNNYCIKEVFDLSIVRKIIFNKATGPAAIITYKNAQGNTGDNVVRHISIKPNLDFEMFKTVIIEKNDIKLVLQKYFIDYDWLWKVMLYGNTLDFRFIKRLKELTTLQDVINENELDFGVGFSVRPNKNKVHRPEYSNGNYLYVKVKKLTRITFDKSKCTVNNLEYFYRPSNKKFFKAPLILIKKGIKKSPVIAYSNKNLVFNDGIYSLSGDKSQKDLIKNIGAYLLSDLTRYYLFMDANQWGIERATICKGEYLTLPVSYKIVNSNLFKYYKTAIEKIKSSENIPLKGYENDTQFFYDKVNEEVAGLMNLKDYENSLIDYVTQISIPLFRNEEKPLRRVKPEEVEKYTDILLKHFKSKFKNINKVITVNIYLNQYFICVYFSISDDKKEKEISINKGYSIKKLVNKLGVLSYEQMTSRLFIRKDVQGFEENGFYVIKTNEYKNWHQAVAYLDINEFMDAILKSGKKKVNTVDV